MVQGLPDRAQVVVVGGGIVGCSVAYHLARLGITDIVVLEQGKLTGGTTWHAAGLVSQLKSNHSLTKLATYSARLYEALEDETGQATGCRTPGSISVAADAERWEEIRRGAAMAVSVGVETREIGIDELRERWPLIRTDDIVGALYIPGDGHTSPVDTTMALAKGARSRGVRIVEDVAVTGLRTRAGAIAGIDTEQGSIETETVVLASGIWTRQLAAQIGVNVPLQACEHFYIVSEPLGLDADTPVLRDPGNYTYFKEETGKIMAGFFEPRGKVWNLDGIPRDFSFGTLPEDWDHIGPIFERSIHRVPALGSAASICSSTARRRSHPTGCTTWGSRPRWTAASWPPASTRSASSSRAGSAGPWPTGSRTAIHPWTCRQWTSAGRSDSRPILPTWPSASPRAWGCCTPCTGRFYQYESARGQRMSPLHDRLDAAGAVWGETAGWERPNWYAFDGQAREYVYSYGKQNWWANAGEECRAVRERVALFDQTSFAKFTVDGPDSLLVLEELSTARIEVPVGRAVYTQWCNSRGGIEADLTVTRLGLDRFLVVTAAAAQTRDWARLRRACRDRDVEIADITEHWAMIGLMGPKARFVLGPLTGASLTNTDFPFGTSQRIDVAGIDVLALRMSYVGELGWELYLPNEHAVELFDVLVEAGEPHGLAMAGYHAMNTLRLESGYRHWGHDITDEDTPIEAGLGFTIGWDKPNPYNGRTALERRATGPATSA